MSNEKAVKAKVKKLLDTWGWFWFMPPANGYGRSGISDFIAVKSGVMLCIETKFGSNKPTPMQVAFCNSIRNEDGFAFVVNEKTLVWLETWLECFDRASKAMSRRQDVTPEDGAAMLDAIKAMTEFL